MNLIRRFDFIAERLVNCCQAFPVEQAVPVELHETEPIRAKAEAMRVVPADAMEPIRAAVALGVPGHARVRVRCAMEPIRVAAAEIRGVRPADATVADRTGEAIHRVTAADRTGAAIPCVKGDLRRDSHRGLALNADCQRNPLTERFARFQANCATEPEFVRRFDIRFRVAVGQGEPLGHPECASAAHYSFRRSASGHFGLHDPGDQRDLAQQHPDYPGLANRLASGANRFQLLRFGSESPNGRNSEPGDVQSQAIPIAERFRRARLSIHGSVRLALV